MRRDAWVKGLERKPRRRWPWAALVVLLLGALLVATAVWLRHVHPFDTDPPAPSATPARSVHVADGDTLELEVGGVVERVRLLGIDAPEVAAFGEPGECGAAEAKAALQGLVAAGTVVVLLDPVADQRDRFGRMLAYVEVDGVDVGRKLVERGLVGSWAPVSSARPQRSDDYDRLEDAARAAKTGSWATCERLGR